MVENQHEVGCDRLEKEATKKGASSSSSSTHIKAVAGYLKRSADASKVVDARTR